MIRRRSLHPGRRSLPLLAIALACVFTLGCPTSSGSDAGVASPSGSTGSTGGSAGSTGGSTGGSGSSSGGSTGGGGSTTPVCGNGDIEAGETCDDGNTTAGDGCSATCQTEPPPPSSGGSASVTAVQSAATHIEGPLLTMPNYTVPEDGLLVVRIGAAAGLSDAVTFAGEEMIHLSSLEVTHARTISVEMFYLPVTAGDSGEIVVDYGFAGTDQKALVASTLVGVDTIETLQSSNAGGPNLAEDTITTTRPDSLVLSVFTAFGSGITEEVGVSHVLDAFPTVPETDFHEMKMQTGHIDATAPGSFTLGYQNTRASGYMDHVMLLAVFSSTR